MRRSVLLLLLALSATLPAQAQNAGSVMAEALGQANVRAAPAIEAEVLGEIRSGESWPVLARSELYPWLLLGDDRGRPMGWVYADLVRLDGDAAGLPLSTLALAAGDLPATATAEPATVAAGAPTPTATRAAPDLVYGQLAGAVNIRQGPGVEYARIAVGQAGERFRLTARHSQAPWVQVSEPRAPQGRAWIALDLLQIQGDLAGLPLVTQAVLRLPTLTPTPGARSRQGGSRRARGPGAGGSDRNGATGLGAGSGRRLRARKRGARAPCTSWTWPAASVWVSMSNWPSAAPASRKSTFWRPSSAFWTSRSTGTWRSTSPTP